MADNALGQVYNRQADIDQELLQIWNKESARLTVIPGSGVFNNEEWLEAENEELQEQEEELIDLITVDGGAKEYDERA